MNVLVIGSGGREHALAWRLRRSPSVRRIYAIPGNPGIAALPDTQCLPAPDLSPKTLLAAAQAVSADLTVVGPEAPLVAGVVDCFHAAKLPIVGPSMEAAQLEGSKVHSKRFFDKHNIPTARFVIAGNYADALAALNRFDFPVVIKADGLAAGKGVVIASDRTEAAQAIQALGPSVVIEEFLRGEEVSFIALCDGRSAIPFVPSQDHKAIFNGDKGPNTGGMGAYCDQELLTTAQADSILETVIFSTIQATGFTGFLYAGLMLTEAGPKVLEFNVRLGDPETQALLHRIDGDFAEILMASARGALSATMNLDRAGGPSVCVVLASAGYPGAYSTGKAVHGIAEAEAAGVTVFHAGTRMVDGRLETAGGRVLGVTASGDDLRGAVELAYRGVGKIRFEGMQYRTDIGHRGLRRYNRIAGT